MRSKWLDWRPGPVFDNAEKHQPSKPTKLGSVGFEGSSSGGLSTRQDKQSVIGVLGIASNWPRESLEAEWRFGQRHARLFPFLGRKVRTPGGPGTLIQVFANRVTVLLDSELGRCTWFHPNDVEPVSPEERRPVERTPVPRLYPLPRVRFLICS